MEPEPCVGLWVRTLRKRRGLTQAQLAARIGRSVNALSALERAQTRPTLDTLCRLAAALGVPVRDFFAPAGEADGARHDALLGELLAAARTLPLADLELAAGIVGLIARRRGR